MRALRNLSLAGLNGVGLDPGPYSAQIPAMLFMAYQLMFAAVTMAIVTSGMAERVELVLYRVCTDLDDYRIRPCGPLGMGGAVSLEVLVSLISRVEVSSIFRRILALAIALVIGKGSGFGTYAMEPHNIPMTLLGAGLLWFGWFGFNGGSALAANGLAANALVVTNTSAAAGALAWLFASWMTGHPSSLGMVSGAIAGLGAITPCAHAEEKECKAGRTQTVL